MDTQADVVLTYRGPAVDGGMMNANDLGTALSGMAGLITETNRALNGDRAIAEVSVDANFERGSVAVHLGVSIGALKTTLDLGVLDVNTILAIIGIGAQPATHAGVVGNVIELVRLLRGRQIEKIEPVPEEVSPTLTGTNIHIDPDGIVNVSIQNVPHDPIQAIREAGIVATNLAARKALSHVTAPLERDGMDEVEIGSDRGRARIVREEFPYFMPPAATKVLEDSSDLTAGTYRILSPSFDGRRWRLAEGQSHFSAYVSNQDFVRDVDEGRVSFVAGDAIKADVKVTQQEGHRPTHEIVRVTDIVRGGTRMPLQPPLIQEAD